MWTDHLKTLGRPTPFARTSSSSFTTASGTDGDAGVDFEGLLKEASPTGRGGGDGLRMKVLLLSAVTVGDTRFRAYDTIQVTVWRLPDPTMASLLGPLDQVRIEGCTTSSSSAKPGQVYYNCVNVRLVRSCWDLRSDDAFLTRQSPLRPFVLTDRQEVIHADYGSFMTTWPLDVSFVRRSDQLEMRVLRLSVWHCLPPTDPEAVPVPQELELCLWDRHCNLLVPGPLTIDEWKAVMADGAHRIPFVALCSPDTRPRDPRYTQRGQPLVVDVVRADFASYLRNHCPVVSLELAQKYGMSRTAPPPSLDPASVVVNVNATGRLPPSADTPIRALTSRPQELVDEARIQQELEQGTAEAVIFFWETPKEKEEDANNSLPPQKREKK